MVTFMPRRKSIAKAPPKLSKTEQDLLERLIHGYQLETDPFGTSLLLRNLKDGSVVRTAAANQNTIKALEERGLIKSSHGKDKLTTIWRSKRAE